MNDEICLVKNYPLLSQIDDPKKLHSFSFEEQIALAKELREYMVSTVSLRGGHLAPSLGVVELTIALFSVLDLTNDRLVWDVGHQAYAHKILTGRFNEFPSLRTYGGISGFPRIAESEFDHFGVGHSSTSISAALGMAMARDLLGKESNVYAVIGDGSMTSGIAFEALNQAGAMGKRLIVVLNDNEMSISQNVGALSSFLSTKLSNPSLTRFKRNFEDVLRQIPKIGDSLAEYAKRGEDAFKTFFTPGILFEALDFTYVGPLDGHDTETLIQTFKQVNQLDKPVLVHVLTQKGRGYRPAEENPSDFHGVGAFDIETGEIYKKQTEILTYTEVFSQTLCELAENDMSIIAITAAMPEGTGTARFAKTFPKRFVDVGICEQHAVTFAAGLATQGFKPAIAIYSTFFQRAFDQILHDVCLQNLDVSFFLDRSGLVGEDGGTHHGAFDLSYFRLIPNIVLMAPKDEKELAEMIRLSFQHKGPTAVRYPRGLGFGVSLEDKSVSFVIGEGELLLEGEDLLVIAVGSLVYPALEAVQKSGKKSAVFNLRFVKPLPEKQLEELIPRFKAILLLEENAACGGMSAGILEYMVDNNLLENKKVYRQTLPDDFVEHGKQEELKRLVGLDVLSIQEKILTIYDFLTDEKK